MTRFAHLSFALARFSVHVVLGFVNWLGGPHQTKKGAGLPGPALVRILFVSYVFIGIGNFALTFR